MARNRDPLRRVLLSGGDLLVTASGAEATVQREWLECGHKIGRKEDAYGYNNAERRRCHKCALGRPQDFDPKKLAV